MWSGAGLSKPPGRGESGVSSVYSDAYTDVSTSWSVSAGAITDTVIVSGSGDTSKKVTGADSVTITLAGSLDASKMSSLHISVWRSKPDADLKIKLVDYGADGVIGGTDNSEHELTYNTTNNNKISGGQWTDLEIKLTDLTNLTSTANIGQIVISSQTNGSASGETLYLDNIYFSKTFSGFTSMNQSGHQIIRVGQLADLRAVLLPIGPTFVNPITTTSRPPQRRSLLHVILGTGTNNGQPIIDPVDLNSNAVLGMWVHSEQAGSEIRIQLGDSATGGWPNDQLYTEASGTTTQAGWNFLTFDFNNPAERFVANGATNGSRGYTAATKFDPNTSYDMLSIFPDLSVEAAIGRSYYFDALAPYTGTVPTEPWRSRGQILAGVVASPLLPG